MGYTFIQPFETSLSKSKQPYLGYTSSWDKPCRTTGATSIHIAIKWWTSFKFDTSISGKWFSTIEGFDRHNSCGERQKSCQTWKSSTATRIHLKLQDDKAVAGASKKRKPIGEAGCCESRMEGQIPLMDWQVVGAVFVGLDALVTVDLPHIMAHITFNHQQICPSKSWSRKGHESIHGPSLTMAATSAPERSI